jgi:hypothetical protein
VGKFLAVRIAISLQMDKKKPVEYGRKEVLWVSGYQAEGLMDKLDTDTSDYVVIQEADQLDHETQCRLVVFNRQNPNVQVYLISESGDLSYELKGNALFLQFGRVSRHDMMEYVHYILAKVDSSLAKEVSADVMESVVDDSDGNLSRALSMLDAYIASERVSKVKEKVYLEDGGFSSFIGAILRGANREARNTAERCNPVMLMRALMKWCEMQSDKQRRTRSAKPLLTPAKIDAIAKAVFMTMSAEASGARWDLLSYGFTVMMVKALGISGKKEALV